MSIPFDDEEEDLDSERDGDDLGPVSLDELEELEEEDVV